MESLLRCRDVEAIVGLSRSTIYTLMNEGRFPEPVTLGPKSVAWVKSEIEGWVMERIAERDEYFEGDGGKLTTAFVKSAEKPGRYGDGGGLWLQVSKWGTKAWLFRYMLNGRARHMGLGSLDTFSLKEARERARQCRQLVADGIDPIEARG